MTTPQSIYQLLPLVQQTIGNIGKDKKNTHQGYNFRGIDDVLNAIGPALAKHGVTVTAQVVRHARQEVETNKGYRVNVVLKLRVTFWGPDGSSLVNCTVGEAQDHNGDKATNKAMSVAFKYACFMGLAIPVAPGVLDDSDHDDKPADTAPAKPAPKAAPKPAAKKAAPKAAAKSAPEAPPRRHPDKPIHPDTEKWLDEAFLLLSDGDEQVAWTKISNTIADVNKRRQASGSSDEVASKLGDLCEAEASRIVALAKRRLMEAKSASGE